ncbi:MAG: MaoC family dehydratase [Actinobacteria bacterium]|nr:MaoC family dehydratase [Actinomycetota bacterium]
MTLSIDGPADLRRRVGTRLGSSEWLDVPQELIDAFAEVTGDQQWIHVDPVRAARESPYGGTVAHGFLTLALLPRLTSEVYRVRGASLMINYGVNKVRFPAPLLVGSRVRATISLESVRPLGPREEVITCVTFEAEGSAKPVCVAESVRLFEFDEDTDR